MSEEHHVGGGPFELLGPDGQRFEVDVAAVQPDNSGALFIATGSPHPEPSMSCMLTIGVGINPRVIPIRIGALSFGDPGVLVMFSPD